MTEQLPELLARVDASDSVLADDMQRVVRMDCLDCFPAARGEC